MAAFFAFVNEDVSIKAIFCIKRKKNGKTFEENKIDLFVPEIQHYRPEDFYEQEDGGLIKSLPRHCKQESAYTIQMYNNKAEYFSTQKNDPFFYLSHMADPRYIIEKYIIKDSRQKRLEIIDSLYRKGLGYEYIYEKTHIDENTQLKDIAVKKLLLPLNN
ncbi:MAG: hypothetical protein K2X37_12585 [Chitinophagaceae bacterium]|nr:hypothetical protein [Chitinophagaceae bacterium]